MKSIFTVDLEDWYQGIAIPSDQWNRFERRIHIGHERLLNLFSKRNVKATYFILGKIVEEYPEIIKQIQREGHEIGCHTYDHKAIYDMTPEEFRNDLRKCKTLAEGLGIKYTGFRAPFFSIDQRSWWALDILKEEGFLYDSSIFPGDSKRTGIPGYRKDKHKLENGFWEVPVSTFKVLNQDAGLGGAYFRILPYFFFKKHLAEISKERNPVFYIHPWELDPKHPYLPEISKRIRYPHYFNLKSTEKRIDRMLQSFEFVTMKEILE